MNRSRITSQEFEELLMSDHLLVADPYHPTAPAMRIIRLERIGDNIVLHVRPNRTLREMERDRA